MRNELVEVADYVLNVMAENNEKQCIDHLPGTTDAFRNVYWKHIESVRELLKNEGLVNWVDDKGYEIQLTQSGKVAAKSSIATYRTENSQEYTTDKLLDKISLLTQEIARLKSTIRYMEADIQELSDRT